MSSRLTAADVAREVEQLRPRPCPAALDALRCRVLRAIADDGCDDPAECAEAVLTTCEFATRPAEPGRGSEGA